MESLNFLYVKKTFEGLSIRDLLLSSGTKNA